MWALSSTCLYLRGIFQTTHQKTKPFHTRICQSCWIKYTQVIGLTEVDITRTRGGHYGMKHRAQQICTEITRFFAWVYHTILQGKTPWEWVTDNCQRRNPINSKISREHTTLGNIQIWSEWIHLFRHQSLVERPEEASLTAFWINWSWRTGFQTSQRGV